MPIVQSVGELVASTGAQWSRPAQRMGLDLYRGRTVDYAALYRTQPNVRLVVRFLARNIASLPLKGYRRVSDVEREGLPPDHELAAILKSPFPAAKKPPTRHRFVRTMVEDLAIFDRYGALKVRNPGSGRLNLVRVPPQMIVPKGGGIAGPDYYELGNGIERREVDPADVIYFHGHNPDDPNDGVSPLEALRRVLAEDAAAGEYREQFWRNATRAPGVITRPVEAGKWSDPARTRFSTDFRAAWSGDGPSAGGTPILEDGMTFQTTGFSAKESEYLGARKLSREEAAALYHVPPAFVGILENANFSNMKEQHVGLYVDTLGPWLDWITEELELQLLAELADVDRVYLDFSLEAKLNGNFEEQAAALQSATGAPWLRRNEARALRNLPPVEGGDELVVPLNVLVGGMASPRDTAPPPPALAAAARTAGRKELGRGQKTGLPHYLVGWEAKHVEVLTGFFTRQKGAVLSRLGARSPLEVAFDAARWNGELRDDLLALSASMADELGSATATDLGGEWSLDRALPWLHENARIAAETINAATLAALGAALGAPSAASREPGRKLLEEVLDELGGLDLLADETPDDPTDPTLSAADVFDLALGARAAQIAVSRATSIGQWSRREGAEQSGARTKTWNVNASPSRHAALDGETVPIADNFSNGAAWPGDPVLGADENAGCLCSLEFGT